MACGDRYIIEREMGCGRNPKKKKESKSNNNKGKGTTARRARSHCVRNTFTSNGPKVMPP